MSFLTESAKCFATAAHKAVGQKRKYTNEPYIVHPEEVVSIIKANVPHASENVIAAAWLHDVVEDTQVSLEDIKFLFGHEVASYVEQLTDVSKPSDGNRAARKKIDLEHTAKCSPEAASIKLADLISNCKSIAKYDKPFAWVYLQEKEQLLKVLNHGNPKLIELAWHTLKTAKAELEIYRRKIGAFTEEEKRILRLIASKTIVPEKLNKAHLAAFMELRNLGVIYLDHWDYKYKVS